MQVMIRLKKKILFTLLNHWQLCVFIWFLQVVNLLLDFILKELAVQTLFFQMKTFIQFLTPVQELALEKNLIHFI